MVLWRSSNALSKSATFTLLPATLALRHGRLGISREGGRVPHYFLQSHYTKPAQLKHSVKPWQKTTNGELALRLYNKERILNYAAALQLISNKTSISVPRLIGFGENDDGTAWIETERTHGGVWLDVVRG